MAGRSMKQEKKMKQMEKVAMAYIYEFLYK